MSTEPEVIAISEVIAENVNYGAGWQPEDWEKEAQAVWDSQPVKALRDNADQWAQRALTVAETRNKLELEAQRVHARCGELEAAIQRVRDLHKPRPMPGPHGPDQYFGCPECKSTATGDYGIRCSTWRALEGSN